MMKWKKTHLEGGRALLEATAEDTTASSRIACGRKAWVTVAGEVIPAHAEVDWDVVRLEVWPDSGRTILFPARCEHLERIDRVAAVVYWPTLERLWAKLEADTSTGDAEFEAQIDSMIADIISAFRTSHRDTQSSFAVEVYSYDDLTEFMPPCTDPTAQGANTGRES